MACDADIAIIFRRGPTRLVRLIGWNLKTHTFQPGQWFKGRIYEDKCDLSPNGSQLVYFAAKHRGEMPTLIAVSTPPYLTAHVLWPALGTWRDLSLFKSETLLALATYRADWSLEPAQSFAVPRHLQVKPKPWPGYFYWRHDHDRLIRDGWVVTSGNPYYSGKPTSCTQSGLPIYRKSCFDGVNQTWLEMTISKSSEVSYTLCDQSDRKIDLKADWADVRGADVFFSRGGKLLRFRCRTRIHRLDDSAIELADFTDMTFEEMVAPYAGPRGIR